MLNDQVHSIKSDILTGQVENKQEIANLLKENKEMAESLKAIQKLLEDKATASQDKAVVSPPPLPAAVVETA